MRLDKITGSETHLQLEIGDSEQKRPVVITKLMNKVMGQHVGEH